MAGYSGTPLPQKLGIKPNHSLVILNAPDDFFSALGSLPDGVVAESALGGGKHDVILFFADSRASLQRRFQALMKALEPYGGLWIAWPKKASGVATDLTEDFIRNMALDAGLVDNKVCAVDETWSGLRLVVRLRDRPKKKASN